MTTSGHQETQQSSTTSFPIDAIRASFPAVNQEPDFVFFDNAAGAQIPQLVFDTINRHLLHCNVQRGGRYAKSIAVDETIARARESVAIFLNARDPREVAFGMNATSFIRLVSLAIGQTLKERDEIVVTDIDHEANVATWLALEREGAKFRWWKMRADGKLHVEDLRPQLSSSTRLVACTVTSNSLGSIVDVAAAARTAHEFGAEIFLDCVHYGPHGVIDVQAFDCDYLACSGYKIFAPHMGFLWGRMELLEKLPTFREDFIPNEPPGKIEAGTFIYENVAGMDAAIRYLEQLGSGSSSKSERGGNEERRSNIVNAMSAIRSYEESLSLEMLRILEENHAIIYGVSDERATRERVPTFAFNVKGVSPAAVTQACSDAGFGIRDGHMYSPRLMKRLNLALDSGVVRVSLVHYNTVDEIHRFGNVLRDLTRHA